MRIFLRSLFFSLCLFLCVGPAAAATAMTDPGQWPLAELESLLSDVKAIKAPGERIVAISAPLVGTPYAAKTLIGGPDQPERLVVDLAGFDCFTLLDMVEALRRAEDAGAVPGQLQQVRYRHGELSYRTRNHFFSDWVNNPGSPVIDVTRELGGERVRRVNKQLNRRADGHLWVPGIDVKSREIDYIPVDNIDAQVLAALRPGDYIGIYSDLAGLDVSHAGLIVIRDGRPLLRHASSRPDTGRVLDEDLGEYLVGKPGILIYRVPR